MQRRKSTNAKPVPLIALHPDYAPVMDDACQRVRTTGRLFEFLERISSFRREGKDRRDAGACRSACSGRPHPLTPLPCRRRGERHDSQRHWPELPVGGRGDRGRLGAVVD